MSLLDNAIKSFRLGLADFNSGEEIRLLSASRNLYAGVLLLFKEKLRRLSPPNSNELLLKQKVQFQIVDGAVVITGKGKNTVTVREIEERFKSLDIKANFKSLEKISKLRNNIEHYYSTKSPIAARGVLTYAFTLFRDFARDELGEDPEKLLGGDVWQSMIEISELHQRERKECTDAITAFEWTAPELQQAALETSCCKCGSSLLEPQNGLRRPDVKCRSCGHFHVFEEFAEQAMREGIDHHRNFMDGGDVIVVLCPVCSIETYHYDAGKCVVCDESVNQQCYCCEIHIPPEELEGDSLCGRCRHQLSKND